jgi:cytosine/adenosine deaminase-related metal-dependent hydrolase
MHLAESKEELQLLAASEGPFRELLEERSMWDGDAIRRGSRPLGYLQSLSAAPRALVIHGNYLAADEIEYLARCRDRMSVVYCPRTHAYFQHDAYPLQCMRKSKVRVVLGTDSRASNPDLDLLADVRFAAALHPEVAPAEWIRMATLDAAAALALDDRAGSLTVAKRADVIALSCDANERDAYAAVVSGAAPLRRVWLNGSEQKFVRGSTVPRTT